MIRLKSLLAEIALGSVTPYATSFVWRRPHPEDDIWEADFQAGEFDWDSESGGQHHIKMVMQRWRTPLPHFESEYQFAFMTRGRDDRGWSTASGNSRAAGTGDLNVLALLKTVALAIRDFSEQTPDCDVIDVTGADAAYEKGEQKTRIYQMLFRDNGMTSGFAMKEYGGKLYLIRTVGRTADATGIADTRGSEEAAEARIMQLPRGSTFEDARRIDGIFARTTRGWSEVQSAAESAPGQVTSVPIADIHITQPNIQSRQALRIAAEGDVKEPIPAVRYPDGEIVIPDGHHRLAAAWALGQRDIPTRLVTVTV